MEGSTRQLVDYYPFGSSHFEQSWDNYQNDYKYTGKEQDEEIGLYYYGARYYDAEVGRWASVDPLLISTPQPILKDPQLFNTYSYTRNNPIMLIDPDGAWPSWSEIKAELMKDLAAFGDSLTMSTPILNDLRDLYEFKTRKDLISGQELTQEQIDMVAALMMVPLISGREGRLLQDVVDDVGRKIDNVLKPILRALPASISSTFKDREYTVRILESDMKVWRVYGGKTPEQGRYLTDFLPSSTSEAEQKLGLPKGNVANKAVEVVIPKGTTVFEGTAGPLDGRPGGATQIFIEDPSKVTYGQTTQLK